MATWAAQYVAPSINIKGTQSVFSFHEAGSSKSAWSSSSVAKLSRTGVSQRHAAKQETRHVCMGMFCVPRRSQEG